MPPPKTKPIPTDKLPAVIDWVLKNGLSTDDVRQVYLMSCEQEEEIKNAIVKNRATTYQKYNLPVNYDNLQGWEKKEVREQYTKEQKGKCFYCKCDLHKQAPLKIKRKKIDWSFFPKNFLKYPVHLQHNHDNGMTEGAVHNYCNAVLWQYEGK